MLRSTFHMPLASTRDFIVFVAVVLGAALLVWSGVPTNALAQDDPEDPTLPDISPREIEVRGDLEISLPSVERQPLTGFNPPPRIPMAPAEHVPFIGEYQQQELDLPRETLELPELTATLERPEPPLRGELGSGIGRYFSRFANARVWIPATTSESFMFSADYDGSNGHAPFNDIDNPHDTFEGQLGFESQRDPHRVDLDVSGYFDSYSLYGATIGDQRDPADVPDLDGWHLSASAGFEWERNVAFSITSALSTTDYETTGGADVLSDFNNQEQRFQIGGDLDVPIGTAEAQFDADFASSGVGDNTILDGDVQSLTTGLRVGVYDSPDYTLSVGGRFLSSSTSDSADLTLDKERRTDRYVLPTFLAQWFPRDGMRLHLRNRPQLEHAALSDRYQENPYLLPSVALRPSVTTTDLEAGFRFFAGAVELSVKGGYRYAPDHLFFTDIDDSTINNPVLDNQATGLSGLHAARYGSARVWHGAAEVTLPTTRGFTMTLGTNLRDGELSETGQDIPNFAPLTARASLSYSFNEQRGLVQLTARYESSRYTNVENTSELDAFFSADLEGSYELTPALGVVARIRNIGTDSTLERWANHPEAPATVAAGLRVQW